MESGKKICFKSLLSSKQVLYLLMPQKHINSKQDSEIKPHSLCLGNVSKDFTVNNIKDNMKKKQD